MPSHNSRKHRQRRRVVLMLQRQSSPTSDQPALPIEEFVILRPHVEHRLSTATVTSEILDWNLRPTCGRIVAKTASGSQTQNYSVSGHPLVVVGSHAACDWSFPGSNLADQHACFLFVDGRIYCVDLTGHYSLKVRGGRFQQIWVRDGSFVEIGDLRLRFHTDSVESDEASTGQGDAPGNDLNPCVHRYLELSKPGAPPWRYEMTRTITLIGRDPPSTIRLKDPTLSVVSSALVQTTAGVWQVDFQSSLRDKSHAAVRCRLWQPGEIVSMGRFQIQLFEEAVEPAAQSTANPHTTSAQPS